MKALPRALSACRRKRSGGGGPFGGAP
jgi:hypothetical protein